MLNLLKNKNDVLFDIDWQGTQQLSKFKELNLLKIFILPPSKKELKKRLIQRNQDKPDVVEERLKAYDSDSAHKNDYDFVVINDNLENCFKEVEKIILKKKDKKKILNLFIFFRKTQQLYKNLFHLTGQALGINQYSVFEIVF